MKIVFWIVIAIIIFLGYQPLKVAAAYRFKQPKLVLEGLSFWLLAAIALVSASWWPLIIAGLLAVWLKTRKKT